MRPILLAGHERPLTSIKFNREGDLFFTSAKDKGAIAWRFDNGERLGTFDGHNGSIWNLDVDDESRRLYTASADNSCKIWDVNTGKELFHIEHPTPCRQVALSCGGTMFANALYPQHKHSLPSTVQVYRVAEDIEQQSDQAITTIGNDGRNAHSGNIVGMLWSATNEHLLTCSTDATIRKWDVETGKQVGIIDEDHTKQINDMQFSACRTHFCTSSTDTTAKLFDFHRMDTDRFGKQALKTYKTSAPVNSAAINPKGLDHLLVVGGQEAADVTTTATGAGKFEIRIFHKIFEEQLGTVKGHFGPVNCVAYAPDGKGYVSGGEEGFIRVNKFDKDYFSLGM